MQGNHLYHQNIPVRQYQTSGTPTLGRRVGSGEVMTLRGYQKVDTSIRATRTRASIRIWITQGSLLGLEDTWI